MVLGLGLMAGPTLAQNSQPPILVPGLERFSLPGTQEVPLREELDFLSRYLDIERTRFGERLTVKMNIAPDTLDALVPNLVLQPLVENAIQHGIEPHARPGIIELHARRESGTLQL